MGSALARGGHDPTTLAEPDPAVTRSRTASAEHYFVPILQELPLLAGRKAYRLGTAPGQLQQAAARLLRRPRDRAAAQQVAGLQVAAVARLVRDDLRASSLRSSDFALYHQQKAFVYLLTDVWERYRTKTPVHVVDVDGVPLLSVYR